MHRPAFAKKLKAIQRGMRSLLEAELKSFGISEGQLEYLIAIFEDEGINQQEVARQLDVGKTAVTKAAVILEKGGFITRTRDSGDGRNYILMTTDKGKTVGRQCLIRFARVQGLIFSEFSLEELEELTSLLDRLESRISELTGRE
ncbi:MAG: MarR family transcriptional regulator [Spirochaetales bacterium]|nr:MarR family transcriptional regulator [Spirochaetales bacterium]